MSQSTLGDEYPKEQARCRDLLGVYRSLGPAGSFGAVMIEDMLGRADRAAMSGDVVEMLSVFGEMRDTR